MTYTQKLAKLQEDMDSQINFSKTAYLQGWCSKKESDKAMKSIKNDFVKNLKEAMEYAVLETPEQENMYQGRIYE